MANTVNAQLFIDGAFTDKTAFVEESIEIEVGPDVETGTRPNQISLTWDNSDLSMDPSNVLSPLYGKIGLNTLCRVRLGGFTRCVGEAAQWQPDRSINHQVSPARGRSWVEFLAMGVLSRLGTWSDPIHSAIYRQITSYDQTKMLGYWPMEGSGTNLPNVIPGGFTGKVTGTATWGGNDGPNGSDKVIELGSDGQLSGSFIRQAAGTGWQVSFAAQLGTAIGSGTYTTLMRWRTSTGVTYAWQVNNGAFQVLVTADDGTTLGTIAASFGTGVTSTTWTRFRCKVTVSGSTVTVEPAWYNQGGIVYGTSGTFSGTSTGSLTNWDVSPNAATNGTGYSHLLATSDTTLDLLTAFGAFASFNGYSGETAGNRYKRLCTEEGIGAFTIGSTALTVAMGPQKPGLFLDLLEECARTDRALLYDEPFDVTLGAALTFRSRINRYGQTSKMDLTYGNGQHVYPPLKKTIDAVGTVNQVTISNADGSTATAVRSTGSRSVLPPPNGVGRLKGTVEVNYADVTQLDDRAAFELNLSTLDRPRYKQVTVSLLANPGLITAAQSIRPGDLITLAGVEPDPVPLHVISFVEQVGHTDRKFVMNCVPGDLWKTGVYGTASAGNVYGVKSTSLNALTGTTGTSLVVNVPDPLEFWSSTATGYDLVIEGERVRVATAFTAPSGGTQTAVVTRSMNGVVRTHTAGAPVLVYNPIHYAY
jgi:hypothetical protein